MKKYLSIIFLILCGFFFFDVQINASTGSFILSDRLDYGSSPLGSDFTGEYFNFFYEKSNNTSFYQFLISGSLPSYSSYDLVSIYDISEICFLESKYSDITFDVCSFNDIYSDLKYVVIYYDIPNSGLKPSYINIEDSNNILSFHTGTSLNSKLYFYSSSASYLGSTSLSGFVGVPYLNKYKFSYQWYQSSWYEFWKNDSYLGSDFSLFFSKIYYFSRYVKNLSKSTLSLYGAILNNRIYEKEFSVESGLSYFNKYPLFSPSYEIKSLIDILSYESTFINYDSTIIDLLEYKGVLLIPKVSSNFSKSDYLLYFKSQFGNNLYMHTSSDIINFSNWTKNDFFVGNNLGLLDMNFTFEKLNTSSPAIYLEPYNYINSIYLYYNSLVYDIFYFKTEDSVINYNGSDISYIDFMKKLNDYYLNWSSENIYGVSCEMFEYFDIQTKSCVPIGTNGIVGIVDENNNSVEIGEALDLSDFISSAWDGAKTFLLAALKISTLSTDFFNTLPSEVGSILLCGFTVGLVIILWKIFRG